MPDKQAPQPAPAVAADSVPVYTHVKLVRFVVVISPTSGFAMVLTNPTGLVPSASPASVLQDNNNNTA